MENSAVSSSVGMAVGEGSQAITNGQHMPMMTMSSILKEAYSIHRIQVKTLQEQIKSLNEKMCPNCEFLKCQMRRNEGNYLIELGKYKLRISELEEKLMQRNRELNVPDDRGTSKVENAVKPKEERKLDSYTTQTNSDDDEVLVPGTPEVEHMEHVTSAAASRRALNCLPSVNFIPETLFTQCPPAHVPERAKSPETELSGDQELEITSFDVKRVKNEMSSSQNAGKFTRELNEDEIDNETSPALVSSGMLRNRKPKSLSKKKRVQNQEPLAENDDSNKKSKLEYNATDLKGSKSSLSIQPLDDPDVTMLPDDFEPNCIKPPSRLHNRNDETPPKRKGSTVFKELAMILDDAERGKQRSPSKKNPNLVADNFNERSAWNIENEDPEHEKSQDLLEAIGQPSPHKNKTEVEEDRSGSESPILLDANSFDRLPSCEDEEVVLHKYKESPVRKHGEREQLRGFPCAECDKFYSDLDETKKAEKLKSCSRHRGHFSPPPNTPKHYWDVEFPSTAVSKQRGYLNQTQKVQLKSRRAKPLKLVNPESE